MKKTAKSKLKIKVMSGLHGNYVMPRQARKVWRNELGGALVDTEWWNSDRNLYSDIHDYRRF